MLVSNSGVVTKEMLFLGDSAGRERFDAHVKDTAASLIDAAQRHGGILSAQPVDIGSFELMRHPSSDVGHYYAPKFIGDDLARLLRRAGYNATFAIGAAGTLTATVTPRPPFLETIAAAAFASVFGHS